MEEATEEEVVVDVMPELEKQHYEEIKELNILVNEAAREHEIKKLEAKSAKEHLEGLQCRLSCLISEGPKKPETEILEWMAVNAREPEVVPDESSNN